MDKVPTALPCALPASPASPVSSVSNIPSAPSALLLAAVAFLCVLALACIPRAAFADEALDAINDAVSNGADCVDIRDYDMNLDDAKTTWSAARLANPCVAWEGRYVGTDPSAVTEILISYDCTADQMTDRTRAYQERLSELAASIDADATDYAKALGAHNVLSRTCTYDFDASSKNLDASSTTQAGALLENRAVCTGYCRAFANLCKLMGIPCIVVNDADANHAWNQAYLEDAWYNIDVTWDDVRDTHRYFALSDDSYALLTGYTADNGMGCRHDSQKNLTHVPLRQYSHLLH